MSDGPLEIDRVSKRYGELSALQDMTFSVPPGEIFGFVGPNGAGKTTTMRIVLGVLAPDSGQVRWQGQRITFAMRSQIGYMPEERGLYPTMGVTEQLLYLAQLHGMRDADARLAVGNWLDRLGLGDRGGEQLQRLSHGNQQRVQLAAALLHGPDLVLLDEPFSGLDPVAVDVMSAVLREQARAGAAVLFSSHQLELVQQLCDRVGIIRSGHMVAMGSVAELRRSGGERFWVDAPTAAEGWASQLAGVAVVRSEGTRLLLQLEPGQSEQTILRAALAAGPVLEFRREEPDLSELFRQAMAEGERR